MRVVLCELCFADFALREVLCRVCFAGCALRVVLVGLCFAKMDDSTAIYKRFVPCRTVCFVLVDLYLAKMNDSTATRFAELCAVLVDCTLLK